MNSSSQPARVPGGVKGALGVPKKKTKTKKPTNT